MGMTNYPPIPRCSDDANYGCGKLLPPPYRPLMIQAWPYCMPCYKRVRDDEGVLPTGAEVAANNEALRLMTRELTSRKRDKVFVGDALDVDVGRRPQPVVQEQPVATMQATSVVQEQPVDAEAAKAAAAAAEKTEHARLQREALERAKRANPHAFVGGASGKPRTRTARSAWCDFCGREYEAKSSPTKRPHYCHEHRSAGVRGRRGQGPATISNPRIIPPPPPTTIEQLTPRQQAIVDAYAAGSAQPRPEYHPTPWASAGGEVDPNEE